MKASVPLQTHLHWPLRLALSALLIATLNGCAERGTSPPQIERLGPATAELRGGSLRVATANLWGVSVLGLDWADEIDARFAEMAERLGTNAPRLDIVLIQEAWKDSARRAMLAQPGVIENFPHRVDALEEPGGAGLVVLSRLPIERAEFHRFRSQGNCFKFWEGDCLSGKGVLAVQIRVGQQRFWIASTHFIACYARDETSEAACDQEDPNGRTRWNQLVEAREFLEMLSGEAPAILGGDFNFTRTSRYYAGMTSPALPREPAELDANARRNTSPDGSSRNSDRADPTGNADHADPTRRVWSETGERDVVAGRIDYLWTRPGTGSHWQARGPAKMIFTNPVELPSGGSMALSDHPILMTSFCRLPGPDGTETPICQAP